MDFTALLLSLVYILGEVFHMGSAEGFTYDEAAASCQDQNAILASTGELYAAWRLGFDKCRAGWLLDRSVRYPINNPRAECGSGRTGVHTVYAHSNQTGFPDLHARFDAYCFRGNLITVTILCPDSLEVVMEKRVGSKPSSILHNEDHPLYAAR